MFSFPRVLFVWLKQGAEFVPGDVRHLAAGLQAEGVLKPVLTQRDVRIREPAQIMKVIKYFLLWYFECKLFLFNQENGFDSSLHIFYEK